MKENKEKIELTPCLIAYMFIIFTDVLIHLNVRVF